MTVNTTGMRRGFTKVFILVCVAVLMTCASAVASSDGEHAPSKGWVKTDTYRVINFAVLAVGLYFLYWKFGSKALNGRIKEIQSQLNDLEQKKKDAEVQLAEYQKKLNTLSEESDKILADYVKQGEEAKERIIQEAESTAVKLEEMARRNIENEFKVAKLRLQQEVIEKAVARAEEIIRENISDDDQEKIIDEYLKKVVA